MLESLTISSTSERDAVPDLIIPVKKPLEGFGYHIRNVDGLGPVVSNIVTSDLAQTDGVMVNHSRIGPRNVVLLIEYKPDYGQSYRSVEELRRDLYIHLGPKEPVRLYFQFESGGGTYKIDGVVESHETSMFGAQTFAQVSILCPGPYFEGSDINITTASSHNTTITNPGDSTTNVKIVIDNQASELASEVLIINTLSVSNTEVGQFRIKDPELLGGLGHDIFVDTDARHRELSGMVSGVRTPLYQYMTDKVSWHSLALTSASHKLRTDVYLGDDGFRTDDIPVLIQFTPLYRGI